MAETTELSRFIMVGGFLGSGKTTALGQLARHLIGRGKRVGLITNDQAEGLVDTLNLRSQGFSVEEIAGGCFCCRFNSLKEAADKLDAQDRPDVFLGEPVGSCTDLLATVAIPMQKLYGNRFDVAPLTVLVDPIRARKILTNQRRGGFSPKVAYIYKKQLEEADAVAVNKIDLLKPEESLQIASLIEEQYPGKRIFNVSARNGEGMAEWIRYATAESVNWEKTLDLDYDIYADGEAELGWLNCSHSLRAENAFDPNLFLKDLAAGVQRRVSESGGEIAHLKMTILSGLDIAVLSLVRNDAVPELSQQVRNVLRKAELTVNGRAEIAPDELLACANQAIEESAAKYRIAFKALSTQAFRPSRPEPVYRTNESTKIPEENKF